MLPYTSDQLQQVMKYKQSLCASTTANQSQQIQSIIDIAENLLQKMIHQKNAKAITIKGNKHKPKNQKHQKHIDYDRHCYTERAHSPRNHNPPLKQFYFDSEVDDNNSDANDNVYYSSRELLGQGEQLQKSQYVPVTKKKNNPEQLTPIRKQKKVTPINNKALTKNTKPQPKPAHKPLAQTKFSLTINLTTPIKHFKKHIIQTVQAKRQQQLAQQQFTKTTRKLNDITQFYSSNPQHIPLYEKSRQLQGKKQQLIELSHEEKVFAQLQPTTFWPMVNSRSQQLIEGTTFESRLEDTTTRKQQNLVKIVYQTLQQYPFTPKLNHNCNRLVESKVKKLWVKGDKSTKDNGQEEMSELRQDESDRDWFTIELGKQYAEKLFIG